jgi:two-component system nitrogen regulation sensor histidine kinase GlnL
MKRYLSGCIERRGYRAQQVAQEAKMAEGYSFTVDRRSRIVSWGEQLGEMMGKTAADTVGKSYHRVFPRLLSDGQDALLLSLSTHEKMLLKAYSLKCPYDAMTADIQIEPVTDTKERAKDDVRGADVTISNILCPVLQKTGSAQRFNELGKIASTLAHGVRNPLNAMKGAVLYLGEKYPAEPTLAEFAAIMEDEIKRFDGFISRFLSTSVSDMEASLTDINGLLKKIQVLTSYQTRYHRIRTVYALGEIPVIMANSFHLEHAILNVMNNAIEVMKGGGRLTVKTGMERCFDSDYIVIEISDTGPGISATQTGRCFPPEKKGRGFGLLITSELLRCYGGNLDIKEKKGKGTVARLYLCADNRGGAP